MKHFHIFYIKLKSGQGQRVDNFLSKLQRKLEFCPLCQGRHRVFYCCDCIVKGEFMHSNPRKPGDLAEKRLQFESVESRRKKLSAKVSEKVRNFKLLLPQS